MTIAQLSSDWALAATRSGGRLSIEKLGNLWPAHGHLQRSIGRVPIAIYSRRVGSAGNTRSVSERRFQNPANVDQSAIDPPAGVEPYLWGMWTEQGPEQMVIVAMDVTIRLGKSRRNSYFIPLERLVAAANTGLATHRNESGEWIAAFVPEDIARYLEWLESDDEAKLVALRDGDAPAPSEELESGGGGRSEGAKSVRYATRYERSAHNRDRAIAEHGLACQVCAFDFEAVYGERGRGFIHVHHNKPISEAGEKVIDPRTDLNVLCPNCHCMVHRRKDETLSVEELRAIYRPSGQA